VRANRRPPLVNYLPASTLAYVAPKLSDRNNSGEATTNSRQRLVLYTVRASGTGSLLGLCAPSKSCCVSTTPFVTKWRTGATPPLEGFSQLACVFFGSMPVSAIFSAVRKTCVECFLRSLKCTRFIHGGVPLSISAQPCEKPHTLKVCASIG
jgi:hypothetical protein